MNITQLPPDLSEFKNLVYLDLSNNPISDYQKAGQSLSTLENLKELRIDLTTVDNVEIILRNLPNLKMLNDKPIQSNLFSNENENSENENFNQNTNNSSHNINSKINNNINNNISINNEIIAEENDYEQKDLPDSSIESEIPNYDVRNIIYLIYII